MSGTLPKSADDSVSQKEKELKTKEKKEDGVIGVSPLPLSEIDAHSVQESHGHDEAEEEEEEEEVEEEEEPLPPGWSEEIYADRVKFYWSVRHGKVSLDRPVGEKSEGDEGSIHSQQQTARTNESIPSTTRSQKTTGGATTDRRNNQSVDEFEKLLRAQMLDRQLKEVLRLGDKELLRAVIVRYEDSKKPSGEQQKNDDDDDDDDESNGLLQRSIELLKSVDYYHHRLREQVRRGHWLQALSTGTAGAGGGKGQRAGGGGTRGRGAGGKGAGVIAKETPGSRFYKLLEKFDRLNSQTEQQRYDQEDEDVCWLRETVSTEDPLRREDVLDDIDSLLKELRRKPDPRRQGPPERTKGPTHGAPKRGPHSSGPSTHGRYDQEDEEEEDEEEREEAERLQRELLILKRVRQFLQQQIDHVDLLGQALRPRDNSLPILAMDKKTMAEIRSYASPKPIVHRVMQAALLLIGYDEATTAVWSNCKSACVPDGRDGLNRRLMKLNVEALHPFIVERSWKILHRIRLEDVQKASPGAATFYVWASGVLRMQGYSIDDDTLEGESNDGKMTQREIVRREQNTLRKPVTSHDDYGNEGYHDERPTYPGALYNI